MHYTTKHGDKVFCETSYDYLWKKSLQEDMLNIFGQAAYDHEEHCIFATESDDHETYVDLFLQPRKGIEDIKRQRWGREQGLHGKMIRRAPGKGEIPQPARQTYEDLPEEVDPFRDSLWEEETTNEVEDYILTERTYCEEFQCKTCTKTECQDGAIDWSAQNWILDR